MYGIGTESLTSHNRPHQKTKGLGVPVRDRIRNEEFVMEEPYQMAKGLTVPLRD